MKHALWLQLLMRLVARPAPLRVIDTHAGAGLYDLQDAPAHRSREAEAGAIRLMADSTAPAAFAPLKAAIGAVNADGIVRYYPGSPLLSLGMLRAGDDYVGCELREDDEAALRGRLAAYANDQGTKAQSAKADGYARLTERSPESGVTLAALIDAPFERGDDYRRIVQSVGRAAATDHCAVFAIWAPLKDLETFDALLRGLEDCTDMPLLVAEARLRSLVDPMTMNGSAMIFINAPDLDVEARAVCEWIAAPGRQTGGSARVRKLGRFRERL